MSLTGSMWTGVSGLLAHTEKMNVIGNNIANVNTIAFKSDRMDFSDFIYANSYNTAGLQQMGLGTTSQTIITSFTQGAFESTTNPTDLAINGSGFFRVNKEGTDEAYYTRAGNFNFDYNGYLKDPNGLVLQGWKIDNTGGVNQSSGLVTGSTNNTSSIVGTGVPTDIVLDAWTVQPFATDYMSFIPNLSADASDMAVNTSNPFAAMFSLWDGTQPPATEDTPPISEQAYSYQMSMKVYDEAGTSHTITIYFDKVDSNAYTGGTDGGSMWEYIVTMDPSEDTRQYWEEDPRIQPEGGQLISMSSTAMAGMLGAGTIEFNSAGQAVNQSTYTFLGSGTPETDPDNYVQMDDGTGTLVWVPSLHSGAILNPAYTGLVGDTEPQYIVNEYVTQNVDDLSMWRSASVSADGYPIIVANFTGLLGAQTSGSPDAASALIEINFGLKASNTDQPWTSTNGSLADLTVDPYLYNSNYNPLNPSYGPQYFLLNENYSTTSMGQINSIINSLRTEWNSADALIWDADLGADVAFTFDKFLEIYQSAANLDEVFGYISGMSGSTLQTDLEATAIAALNMLSDPDGSSIPGMSLIETAFQYKFNDYIDGTEGMVDSAGNPVDPFDATAMPDITSNAMQYIMSYQINGSAKVDLSNCAEATPADANALSTFTSAKRESSAIQSMAGSSATYSQTQNGYAFGNLSAYYVDQDGILSGVYSNGITLGLYQICMYDFVCDQGLRAEGGNLYSQTKDSGEPKSGPCGVAGLGVIISECIEQSNVDLAREFVLMITTQRGFQGNSKMITTVDTMLDTVIQMKR